MEGERFGKIKQVSVFNTSSFSLYIAKSRIVLFSPTFVHVPHHHLEVCSLLCAPLSSPKITIIIVNSSLCHCYLAVGSLPSTCCSRIGLHLLEIVCAANGMYFGHFPLLAILFTYVNLFSSTGWVWSIVQVG